MIKQDVLEEFRERIEREERIRELVGEEAFEAMSDEELETNRLIDQLADILVDIFLEQEGK